MPLSESIGRPHRHFAERAENNLIGSDHRVRVPITISYKTPGVLGFFSKAVTRTVSEELPAERIEAEINTACASYDRQIDNADLVAVKIVGYFNMFLVGGLGIAKLAYDAWQPIKEGPDNVDTILIATMAFIPTVTKLIEEIDTVIRNNAIANKRKALEALDDLQQYRYRG